MNFLIYTNIYTFLIYILLKLSSLNFLIFNIFHYFRFEHTISIVNTSENIGIADVRLEVKQPKVCFLVFFYSFYLTENFGSFL